MTARRTFPFFPSTGPTVGRFLAGVSILVFLEGATPAQQSAYAGTLTEREAVTAALGRAPLTDALEGTVSAEEGRARTVSARPNPGLNYMREQTFGKAGTGEDYLTATQTLDLGGRRGLRGQAGEVRMKAVRRDGDMTRLGVAAETRRRFHDLLYWQMRVAAVQVWGKHVAVALDIITKREQKGDVARYDRRRLEREQVVATGRLSSEKALLDRAQARLQAIIGAGAAEPVTAAGDLLPEAEPPPIEQLRAAGRVRPDFLALDLRAAASSIEQRAAGRWWVPDLRLEGGWKGVTLPVGGRTDGFLLGFSLTPPLWDRSQGLALAAAGEARAARARRMLLESELGGELDGARATAVQFRQAAVEFRDRGSATSDDLVRMASVGYEGGELGVLELLDAYRGAAEDELTTLDLEHEARRSRIELDELTGAALP